MFVKQKQDINIKHTLFYSVRLQQYKIEKTFVINSVDPLNYLVLVMLKLKFMNKMLNLCYSLDVYVKYQQQDGLTLKDEFLFKKKD